MHLFFRFLCHSLPLLLLLLVFLAFRLWLQNVVHQVIDVHVGKLLIDCLTLLVLGLKFLPLPLVHPSLLLISALPLLAEVLVVVTRTNFCHTSTHTFRSLECPLMLRKRLTTVILVLAYCIRILLSALLPLGLPHLLVLLLQL